MKFKKGDLLLIGILLLFSISLYKNSNNKKNKVEIISPYKKFVFSLNGHKKVKIKGKKGFLIVEINHGKIRVIKSTCVNKICIKTGWITKIGESIVCVPNRVIVKIIGNEEKDIKQIDFLTR